MRNRIAKSVRMSLAVAMALAMIALAPPLAAAQNLTCTGRLAGGDSGECEVRLANNPARELLSVRVTRHGQPAAGETVVFYMIDSSWRQEVVTSEAGVANAIWERDKVDGPLTVRAQLKGDTGSPELRIRILPPVRARILHQQLAAKTRYGFADRQLRDPVTLTLAGPTARDDCEAVRVSFEAFNDGSSAPKVASGRWVDEQCAVSTYWRLGRSTGSQILAAQVVGSTDAPAIVRAGARGAPTFVVGVAIASETSYFRLQEKPRTIRVSRPDSVGGGTIAFDSIHTDRRPDRVAAGVHLYPVAGIDWPLVLGMPWLRMSLSGSVENPRNDWFFGISLLHLIPRQLEGLGITQEGTGMNLHFVVHGGRRTMLTNPLACGADLAACNVHQPQRVLGAGALLSFNGSDLLQALRAIVPLP